MSARDWRLWFWMNMTRRSGFRRMKGSRLPPRYSSATNMSSGATWSGRLVSSIETLASAGPPASHSGGWTVVATWASMPAFLSAVTAW